MLLLLFWESLGRTVSGTLLELGKTLVVVAHPDDEAVGCGLLLQRSPSTAVAFMTDGAPKNRYFWDAYKSRQNYATVRRRESERAIAQIEGLSAERFDAPDQELFRHLDQARDWLSLVVDLHRPNAIVTHSYEGGHPDHDACSFLCSLIGRQFGLPVWEMPLYRRSNDRLVRQRFLDGDADISLVATERERNRKQKMISSYRSQLEFLNEFQTVAEDYRPQPAYDFSRPPHEGQLNYESWGWRISGVNLCNAFERALRTKREERVAKSA